MNPSVDKKVESLLKIMDINNFDCYNEEVKHGSGIGGGYSQFGILTEEELLELVKANSKRVHKFQEKPEDYKQRVQPHYHKSNKFSSLAGVVTEEGALKSGEVDDGNDEQFREYAFP